MTDHDIDLLDQAVYKTARDYVNPNNGQKGVVGLAPIMGMNASTLQHKVNRNSDQTLSIKESRSFMLAANDFRVLETLAHGCGFAAYKLPNLEVVGGDLGLLEAWSMWQEEIADTIKKMREALSDRKITQVELAEIETEFQEDFERGLALLAEFRRMADSL